MKNARLFLIIQSILYILLAGLLIAAVIGIYKDGAALRAEDPLAAIFSQGRRQGTVLCLLFPGEKGDTEPSPVSSRA